MMHITEELCRYIVIHDSNAHIRPGSLDYDDACDLITWAHAHGYEPVGWIIGGNVMCDNRMSRHALGDPIVCKPIIEIVKETTIKLVCHAK